MRKHRQVARVTNQPTAWLSPGRRLFVRYVRRTHGCSAWWITGCWTSAHTQLPTWRTRRTCKPQFRKTCPHALDAGVHSPVGRLGRKPTGRDDKAIALGQSMSRYRRLGRLTLRKGLCLVCLERSRGGNRAFMGGFRPATAQMRLPWRDDKPTSLSDGLANARGRPIDQAGSSASPSPNHNSNCFG